MLLEVGTVVGKYRLVGVLGRGGMGTVWEALHLERNEPVALKLLRDDLSSDPVRRTRLVREARAAASVAHPNVVGIREVFVADDGSPVIVMELLKGETLGARLAREGALPLRQTASLLAPVVNAVASAHAAGVIHRDLKPENIFLEDDAGETVPRVLDFGIAKLPVVSLESVAAGSLTATGTVLGTPHYMAPEQLFSEGEIDHRADVWALGAVLYECLTGMRPLGGGSLGQLLKAMLAGNIAPLRSHAAWVPADLARIIDGMLSRDREARPGLLVVYDALVERAGSLSTTLRAARPVEPAAPISARDDGLSAASAFRPPRRLTGPAPPLPRAPGESKFNIKGVAYSGLVRFVTDRVPGGLDALCGKLDDTRLHDFVRQPFVGTARYDILPLVPLTAAIAGLVRVSFEQLVRGASIAQCDYDSRTIFREVFQGARAVDIVDRITSHGTWYYDFGRTVADMTEPGVLVLTYFGQPAYVEPWFSTMHVAYTEETLRILGATEIVATMSDVAPGGSRHGLSLIDVRTTVRWR